MLKCSSNYEKVCLFFRREIGVNRKEKNERKKAKIR